MKLATFPTEHSKSAIYPLQTASLLKRRTVLLLVDAVRNSNFPNSNEDYKYIKFTAKISLKTKAVVMFFMEKTAKAVVYVRPPVYFCTSLRFYMERFYYLGFLEFAKNFELWHFTIES
jgi:hypothetical protein